MWLLFCSWTTTTSHLHARIPCNSSPSCVVKVCYVNSITSYFISGSFMHLAAPRALVSLHPPHHHPRMPSNEAELHDDIWNGSHRSHHTRQWQICPLTPHHAPIATPIPTPTDLAPPASTSVPIAIAHNFYTLQQCSVHTGNWHQPPCQHGEAHKMHYPWPGPQHWAQQWWQRWGQGDLYCETGPWCCPWESWCRRRADTEEVGGLERMSRTAG